MYLEPYSDSPLSQSQIQFCSLHMNWQCFPSRFHLYWHNLLYPSSYEICTLNINLERKSKNHRKYPWHLSTIRGHPILIFLMIQLLNGLQLVSVSSLSESFCLHSEIKLPFIHIHSVHSYNFPLTFIRIKYQFLSVLSSLA